VCLCNLFFGVLKFQNTKEEQEGVHLKFCFFFMNLVAYGLKGSIFFEVFFS